MDEGTLRYGITHHQVEAGIFSCEHECTSELERKNGVDKKTISMLV